MSTPEFSLTKLIHPLDVEAFIRDAWEKRPQVIQRGDPDYYAGLFSLCDVDELIAFTRPKFLEPAAFRPGGGKFHNFVQGFLAEAEPFPLAVYPNVTEVHQAFSQGKTVIITALQHRRASVARLCRDLESFFECSVHANMYLTPPGAQGFDPHEVCLRQSLPPGLLTSALPACALPQFRKLLHVLVQNAHFTEAVEGLAASFVRGLSPLPSSYFADPDEAAEISPDTVLEKQPGMIHRVEELNGHVSLMVPGNRLDGPAKIAAALHFVTRTPRFAVRSLPDDLSEKAKLVLTRRLVDEKFLIVAANGDVQPK